MLFLSSTSFWTLPSPFGTLICNKSLTTLKVCEQKLPRSLPVTHSTAKCFITVKISFDTRLSVILTEITSSSLKFNWRRHHDTDIIIIILLQECAFFYFWSPADVPRIQGSAGFRSLVSIFHDFVPPTFANLWQLCHIPSLLSISFSVFCFFVPSTSICSAFAGPSSSSIFSTCPNHNNLCSLRYSSNLSTPVKSGIFLLVILSLMVLLFRHHSQHSYFGSHHDPDV